jgi:predicted transposase YbfD/YdcC
MVESSRETNGKIEHETRFYLTSLVMVAALIGPIVRSHWSIENAHSDDCSHRFRSKPAICSERSQPGIPMIPAG